MTTIDTFHPAVSAADNIVAAVGEEGAAIVLWALRADWLLRREAERLEPIAAGIAYLLKKEVPRHRGQKCRTSVVRADVGEAISRILRQDR